MSAKIRSSPVNVRPVQLSLTEKMCFVYKSLPKKKVEMLAFAIKFTLKSVDTGNGVGSSFWITRSHRSVQHSP